jgi:hypothetical protein
MEKPDAEKWHAILKAIQAGEADWSATRGLPPAAVPGASGAGLHSQFHAVESGVGIPYLLRCKFDDQV